MTKSRTRVQVPDLLIDKFSVETNNGTQYSLERRANAFILYEKGKEVGKIVQNDSLSGSLWIKSNHLADYDFFQERYRVFPTADVTTRPGHKEIVHPLDYLVQMIDPKATQMPRYIPSIIIDEGEN